jgi:hypothetical protein
MDSDDNTPRTLYCLVEGEYTVFKVTASLDKDIGDFKVLIHQRINLQKYAVGHRSESLGSEYIL